MRAVLALALCACGPKAPPAHQPTLDGPKSAVTGEPFAVAAVVWDVDVFATTPMVELPSDAQLDVGTSTSDVATVGTDRLTYSLHTLRITLNDDFEHFEKAVAPKVAAAVELPPGMAIVWAREENDQIGAVYNAVVIHTPPLLTTRDLASADDIPWPKISISLDNDKSKTEDIHAVKVALSEEPATRYAAWRAEHAGHPLAMIVFGRVAKRAQVPPRQDPKAPLPKAADVASFVVELEGVPPNETRAMASALATEVAARRKNRSH